MIRTHEAQPADLATKVQDTRHRLVKAGDTALGPVSEKLNLLTQLTEFEFGRYLVMHGGFSGRWSNYAFYEFPILDARGHDFHHLERIILNFQSIRSSRERVGISQAILTDDLFEGMTFLSVPCGVMSELLTMDFGGLKKFRITGADLDQESLELARAFALERGIVDKTEFILRDAWALGFHESFDRVLSLGLNMYCSDLNSALDLYRSLHGALKSGGKLILSYISPLLGSPDSERRRELVTEEEDRLSKVIFAEIIESRHQRHFNTTPQIIERLKSVGFTSVRCYHSTFRGANIAVAQK